VHRHSRNCNRVHNEGGYQMKTEKRNPWHPADAKGFQDDKTYVNAVPFTLEPDAGLAYRQCSDDGIAVDVSRLGKPLSIQAVILKVRAHIAARGLPLPECIFISPENHPEALMDLASKVQE